MARKPFDRIQDIQDAITTIRDAPVRLRLGENQGDPVLVVIAYDAILYRLLLIGEAINDLPDLVTDSVTHMPRRDTGAMRNLLAHQYHQVDSQIITATIAEPLAQLEQALPQMRKILGELDTFHLVAGSNRDLMQDGTL